MLELVSCYNSHGYNIWIFYHRSQELDDIFANMMKSDYIVTTMYF